MIGGGELHRCCLRTTRVANLRSSRRFACRADFQSAANQTAAPLWLRLGCFVGQDCILRPICNRPRARNRTTAPFWSRLCCSVPLHLHLFAAPDDSDVEQTHARPGSGAAEGVRPKNIRPLFARGSALCVHARVTAVRDFCGAASESAISDW